MYFSFTVINILDLNQNFFIYAKVEKNGLHYKNLISHPGLKCQGLFLEIYWSALSKI